MHHSLLPQCSSENDKAMPYVTVAGEAVEYTLRYSRRARRGRIVVTLAGVELVVPYGGDADKLHGFVESKGAWISEKHRLLRARARSLPAVLPDGIRDGGRILLGGRHKPLAVMAGARRRVRVDWTGSELCIQLPSVISAEVNHGTLCGRALSHWLRQHARECSGHAVARYARSGMRPREIRIKDQRSRWGSCGATGIINLNWRLVCTPPEVLDYVVVHELCHLREPNHSQRFWSLVSRVMPNYEPHKQWLREHDGLLEQPLP